jgi:hypothetical protein
MAFVFVLFLLLAGTHAENLDLEEKVAMVFSEMAYQARNDVHLPLVAARNYLQFARHVTVELMGEQRRMPSRGGYTYKYVRMLKNLQWLLKHSIVIGATRDCVAVSSLFAYQKEGKLHYRQGLIFGNISPKNWFLKEGRKLICQLGFRGTAERRDLAVNMELATDAGKIERLDEAVHFVRETSRFWKLLLRSNDKGDFGNDRMVFVGHSLGGFIAEGVLSHFPGARSYVFQPGAPLVGNGYPSAFKKLTDNPRIPRNLPVRYVRKGDPVTLGLKNLGPGKKVARSYDDSEKLYYSMFRKMSKRHSLDAYTPWKGHVGQKARVSLEKKLEKMKARLDRESRKKLSLLSEESRLEAENALREQKFQMKSWDIQLEYDTNTKLFLKSWSLQRKQLQRLKKRRMHFQ